MLSFLLAIERTGLACILLYSLSAHSSVLFENVLPSGTFNEIKELVNRPPLDHDFSEPLIPLDHRIALVDSDILKQSHEFD